MGMLGLIRRQAPNGSMIGAVVALADVRRHGRAGAVLNGISMSVQAGTLACVIGPTGAGKSVLLRCIAGLLPVQAGSIRVSGTEVNDRRLDKPRLRRHLGLVVRENTLLAHRSVLQNVMLPAIETQGRNRADAEAEARSLLHRFRLEARLHDSPEALSRAEQQRAAIARALALHPRVLLLDAPTADLDRAAEIQLLFAIRELTQDGITCILATDALDFVRRAADTVFVMEAGRIVAHGTPQDVFADPPPAPMTKLAA